MKPPAKPVVVNTRPQQQAATLTARLQSLDIEVFPCPALEILPVADSGPLQSALTRLDQYHLVIFVSPNAIEQALKYLLQAWPQHTAIGVMGPGSRATLAAHGISAPDYKIISPALDLAEQARFDSESLLEQLRLDPEHHLAVPLAQARVLVLRGTHGRDLIVEQLRAQGAQVEAVPCYQRRTPPLTAEQQGRWRALAQGRQSVILIATSSEGLRNLCDQVLQTLDDDGHRWLRQQIVLAPHPRIAEQAKQLGFANIRLSGAGDDNIVQKITEITTTTHINDMNQLPQHSEADASSRPTAKARRRALKERLAQWKSTQWGLLGLAAALVALFFWAHGEVDRLQRELARRTQESQSLSRESETYARTAQDIAREMQSRMNVLEANIAQSRSQQAALEQLYQELSRSRDEWALAEIEQVLAIASQQLQLAGNVQGAIIALQTADARLARSDRPQFLPLRRVLARDLERLRALPFVDLAGLTLKIDSVIGNIDNLPLLADAKPLPPVKEKTVAPAKSAAKPAPRGAQSSGLAVLWQQTQTYLGKVYEEAERDLSNLIQVRRVDHPDALLLAPEQTIYLRENLKLRLLNARLALLSRNEAAYRADLKSAIGWLEKYFDANQKAVAADLATLKQLQTSTVAIELPTLADSLNAVRNFKPVQGGNKQ